MTKPRKTGITKAMLAATGSDIGPPRPGITVEPREVTKGGQVASYGARVKVDCTLDRYHERAQITDRQLQAGLRFREAWHHAIRAPAVTSAYGERLFGRSDDATASGVDGRARVNAALACLTQPQQTVIIDVCGTDAWAGGTHRLAELRSGLTVLADWWGMAK